MIRPKDSKVRHGEPACARYGCKRPECLQALRKAKKRNKYLREHGQPYAVDPARAAAHLRRFREAGFADREIMGIVGVSQNTFYKVMRGSTCSRDTVRSILAIAVPARSAVVECRASVDATGTRRRLQALGALGWPNARLTAELGSHPSWIGKVSKATRVSVAYERRVFDLYNRLWDKSPESQGVPSDEATAVREKAKRLGWQLPMAWDDDSIGDPAAIPRNDAVPPKRTVGENVVARFLMGESVILDKDGRREVIVHFMEWTDLSPEQIGERLEMTAEAVSRSWERSKAKARAEGGKRLWRRVYIPVKDRGLNRDEMESAA